MTAEHIPDHPGHRIGREFMDSLRMLPVAPRDDEISNADAPKSLVAAQRPSAEAQRTKSRLDALDALAARRIGEEIQRRIREEKSE